MIFIEKGTTKEQKSIESTLKEVAEGKVTVYPPAIFLIGDVVSLRKKIHWFENQLEEIRL